MSSWQLSFIVFIAFVYISDMAGAADKRTPPLRQFMDKTAAVAGAGLDGVSFASAALAVTSAGHACTQCQKGNTRRAKEECKDALAAGMMCFCAQSIKTVAGKTFGDEE